MRPANAYRMLWNCDRDGCFNRKRRPKFEAFADCFSGRINFSDVDGMVEIGGAFLLLEWKGEGGKLKAGQVRTYMAFSALPGCLVVAIEGDAETMTVRRYRAFVRGFGKSWTAGGLSDVADIMRGWAEWRNDQRSDRVFHVDFG